MTAFNKTTDLPSNIDTLEKLALWVGSALHSLNSSMTAIEGDGEAARVAQFQPFFVQNDNTNRAYVRLSIKLESDYTSNGKKLWNSAEELSQTALPTSFKS